MSLLTPTVARRADFPGPARTGGRVLGRKGLWMIAAAMAAVYVIVLLIVAAAR